MMPRRCSSRLDRLGRLLAAAMHRECRDACDQTSGGNDPGAIILWHRALAFSQRSAGTEPGNMVEGKPRQAGLNSTKLRIHRALNMARGRLRELATESMSASPVTAKSLDYRGCHAPAGCCWDSTRLWQLSRVSG